MRWLVFVPTPFERQKLDLPESAELHVEVCGFGLVAAAANASRLIAQHEPEQILLCGIAGALNDEVKIGSAYQFKRAALFGVGVGHGVEHVSAEQLGWKQLQGRDYEIGAELSLAVCSELGEEMTRDLIVSCCSASAKPADAALVREHFPTGMIEEMEGFAVAAAAKIAAVPCFILRGISNIAGDREHANWEVDGAMQAVSKLATVLIGSISD